MNNVSVKNVCMCVIIVLLIMMMNMYYQVLDRVNKNAETISQISDKFESLDSKSVENRVRFAELKAQIDRCRSQNVVLLIKSDKILEYVTKADQKN